MVISSNRTVGHLHFFSHFPISRESMEHGVCWSQIRKQEVFYSTPGPHPHQGRGPISVTVAATSSGGAEEPANSFIHTANICWIPISQALQGDSNTRAFYWISQKPQCQLGEWSGGWAKPTLQTLYTLEPTRMYSVGLGCALSLWKSGWAMLHALLQVSQWNWGPQALWYHHSPKLI